MCKCVESFSPAVEVNRKRRGLFPPGYLGVVDKEEVSFCTCGSLFEDFSGGRERECLNLDTEKEAALAVVIPQRQITCWIRGVEFTFIAVDQDSSDHHKTRFNFFLGETVMTAESVCVSVSLTPLCY